MAAQQLMIESFARLFARHGSGRRPVRSERPDQHRVRSVIELMRARYHEPLTLEDLALPLGVSTYQLIGLFKRTVGLTPHSYLTQIRLGAACSLLKREVGHRRRRRALRVLRSERAHQPLQALLRTHPAAVRARLRWPSRFAAPQFWPRPILTGCGLVVGKRN